MAAPDVQAEAESGLRTVRVSHWDATSGLCFEFMLDGDGRVDRTKLQVRGVASARGQERRGSRRREAQRPKPSHTRAPTNRFTLKCAPRWAALLSGSHWSHGVRPRMPHPQDAAVAKHGTG